MPHPTMNLSTQQVNGTGTLVDYGIEHTGDAMHSIKDHAHIVASKQGTDGVHIEDLDEIASNRV